MFEKDGIVYASGEAKEIKISEVKPLVGRMLLLTFTNGEKRLFDTTKLTGPVFDKLDDENIFSKPEIFHGFVTWDEGNIDVAPETMYYESIEYEQIA